MSHGLIRGAVQAALRDGHPEQAFDRLAALLLSPSGSLREKWEAHNLLPFVVQKLSGAAVNAHRQEQAGRCRVELPRIRRFVGRAEFPVVSGRARRFVMARISGVSIEEDVLPTGLNPQTERAITDALAAARVLAGEAIPRSLRVDLEETDAPIEGRSLGLAVGVAALAYLQRLELPESAIFSGELRPNGQVVSVTHIDEKLALLHESRPAATLFLPADNHSDDPSACHVASLSGTIQHLGLDSARDLDADLGQMQSDYTRGRWLEAARQAQLLLTEPGLRIDEQLKLRTVLLAAANHQGDSVRATQILVQLRQQLIEASVSPQTVALALANAAVHCIDLLRGDDAQSLLNEATRLALPSQDPCWVHLYGTASRVNILLGDLDGALALRIRNAQECIDDERPRCLGDLADVYLRLDFLHDAEAALQRALEELASLRPLRRRVDYLKRTEQHLRLHEARLRRARGDLVGARHSLASVARAGAVAIPELLQIEIALLADSLSTRLAALETVFAGIPRRDATIFRALAMRARILAGDSSAESELGKLLGLQGRSGTELCRRLPY